MAREAPDPDRLEQLLQASMPGLRAFIRTQLGPELRLKESSADLVQSVCRELVAEGERDFEDEQSFRAWLFAAALNKIRNRGRYYRQQRRDMAREADVDPHADEQLLRGYSGIATPSQAVSMREQLTILEQALDDLEPDHREVISYARLAGLQAKEIGTILGRSEAAVRALLGRALVQLGAALRRRGLTPPGETR